MSEKIYVIRIGDLSWLFAVGIRSVEYASFVQVAGKIDLFLLISRRR